jgi:L-glyceraldehyde 3-phosphate reductase
MGALATAVQHGKALYVGVSSYSAAKTREAVEILQSLGTPLLIHQPSYSMLNRWIEEELLDVLGQAGVGCIGFSPLAQGMLTGKYLEGRTRVLVGWDIEEELKTISAPVLVVHDRSDPLSPREHAEGVIRSVPHAVLSWYHTGRHGPHYVERERFDRELEAHLRAAESPSTLLDP